MVLSESATSIPVPAVTERSSKAIYIINYPAVLSYSLVQIDGCA